MRLRDAAQDDDGIDRDIATTERSIIAVRVPYASDLADEAELEERSGSPRRTRA